MNTIIAIEIGVSLAAAWFFFLHALWTHTTKPTRSRLIRLDEKTLTIVMLILPSVAVLGLTLAISRIQRVIGWTGVQPPLSFEGSLITAVVSVFGSTFAFLWLKRHRFLRQPLRGRPRCDRCDYCLRGISRSHGSVRCPECCHEESARNIVRRVRHEKNMAHLLRAALLFRWNEAHYPRDP